MANSDRYLKIDGIEYKVPIIDLKRTVDTLDSSAYRTEDGVLHRNLIGIYSNYDVTIGKILDVNLYYEFNAIL